MNRRQQAYEGHLKWLRLEESALEKQFAEGLKEGEAKGRKEEKYEIARLMLQEGDSFEKIQRLTGLTLEDLKSLT